MSGAMTGMIVGIELMEGQITRVLSAARAGSYGAVTGTIALGTCVRPIGSSPSARTTRATALGFVLLSPPNSFPVPSGPVKAKACACSRVRQPRTECRCFRYPRSACYGKIIADAKLAIK